MAEKTKKAEPQKEAKAKTAGNLFNVVFCIITVVILLVTEQRPIGIMLKKSPSSSTTKTVLFAAVLLYDFVFIIVFGMAILFNLISKTIGSYPKNSLLLKLDSFLDNAFWWLMGGLIFGRWILQMIVMSYYPISAWE
jgi:hypothetical protein